MRRQIVLNVNWDFERSQKRESISWETTDWSKPGHLGGGFWKSFSSYGCELSGTLRDGTVGVIVDYLSKAAPSSGGTPLCQAIIYGGLERRSKNPDR